MRRAKSSKKNMFCCKKKNIFEGPVSLNGLRRQVGSLEKVVLLHHKMRVFITMRARQAAAPRQARLESCSLDHLQEGVPEVVKNTFSVV